MTFIPFVSALRINEIMYNPEGNEFDFEYIELYAENETDVSDFYFEGITFKFPKNTTIKDYLIIANTKEEEGENNDFKDKYQRDADFEFDGSLTNSGETISLRDAYGNIVDSVSYGNDADEGFSLEFFQQDFVQSLIKEGTPGIENSHFNHSLESGEFLADTSAGGCSGSINIGLLNDITKSGESIKFIPSINISNNTDSEKEFTIEYYITDIFGEIVKAKTNTTNTNQKSYTPKIEESDKVFTINMNLYLLCDKIELVDSANKNFIVFNENLEETINEPFLEIQTLYTGSDKRVKFGEILNVKIKANKGNSTKKSITIFIEDLSKETSINIDSSGTFTLPIQIPMNCDRKYSEGRYLLVAEGLGKREYEGIDIYGFAECNKKEKNTTINISSVEIQSFYTRTKVFEEQKNITIYSNLHNTDFSQDITINFRHNNYTESYDVKIMSDENLKTEFVRTLERGNNNFSLEVWSKNSLVDRKLINAPVPLSEDLSTKPSEIEEERFKNTYNLTRVSEGKSVESKDFINYALLGISVLFNSLLIWKR